MASIRQRGSGMSSERLIPLNLIFSTLVFRWIILSILLSMKRQIFSLDCFRKNCAHLFARSTRKALLILLYPFGSMGKAIVAAFSIKPLSESTTVICWWVGVIDKKPLEVVMDDKMDCLHFSYFKQIQIRREESEGVKVVTNTLLLTLFNVEKWLYVGYYFGPQDAACKACQPYIRFSRVVIVGCFLLKTAQLGVVYLFATFDVTGSIHWGQLRICCRHERSFYCGWRNPSNISTQSLLVAWEPTTPIRFQFHTWIFDNQITGSFCQAPIILTVSGNKVLLAVWYAKTNE